MLSHGTGGSAMQLAWLGSVLARHGFIAVGVNHPGNNALEPYTAEGFVLWWERATDISDALDALLLDPMFGPHVDEARIGAAGDEGHGRSADESKQRGVDPSTIVRGLCLPLRGRDRRTPDSRGTDST